MGLWRGHIEVGWRCRPLLPYPIEQIPVSFFECKVGGIDQHEEDSDRNGEEVKIRCFSLRRNGCDEANRSKSKPLRGRRLASQSIDYTLDHVQMIGTWRFHDRLAARIIVPIILGA